MDHPQDEEHHRYTSKYSECTAWISGCDPNDHSVETSLVGIISIQMRITVTVDTSRVFGSKARRISCMETVAECGCPQSPARSCQCHC